MRYELCPKCDGSGVTTEHVECEGGGITASEWDEICHDDPDFPEDYFGGLYDRPCPTCKGLRVVEVEEDDEDTRKEVIDVQ